MATTDSSPAPQALGREAVAASARDVVLAIQDAFSRADYARMAALYDDEIERLFHFHRVRDGRLVHYRGFNDSFDAAEQVLGRLITPCGGKPPLRWPPLTPPLSRAI